MKPQIAVTINKVNIATAYTESYTTWIKFTLKRVCLLVAFIIKGNKVHYSK